MKGLKRYYTQTTEGPYLEINEDKYVCLAGERVFGVIDGFGGSGIGDNASELIANTILENYGSLVADKDVTMPIFYNPSYSIELNALANTTMLAHELLKNQNAVKDSSKSGGASILVGVAQGNTFLSLGVGKCLGLKVTTRDLIPFSMPDASNSFSLIQGGHLTEGFPFHALGMDPSISPRLNKLEVNEGEIVLMLTDGVFGAISALEIFSVFKKNDFSVKESVADVMALANDRGNKDNQTVVALEF